MCWLSSAETRREREREREREGRKDFEVMLAWMNVIFAWRTHG